MTNFKGQKPTKEMSEALQGMRDYLNMALFDGELPECFITLTRNSNVIGGYHSPEQWENEEGVKVSEVGINSNIIADGNANMLFEVLIHELIHLEQHTKGIAGRTGYHNKAFADRCDELGLKIICSDPGATEGQRTGQAIATEMDPKGLAAQAVAHCGIDLPYWTSDIIDIDEQGQPQKGQEPRLVQPTPKSKPKSKSGSRTKYVCATCGMAVWGKSGLGIMCIDCGVTLIES